MRAPVAMALTGVLLASALTGCGGDGGDTAASKSGAFPVSIPNAFGTTQVKKQPKRVVSIGYQEHDILLGLGVVPLGVKQFHPEFADGVGPWAEKRLGDSKPKVFPAMSTEIDIAAIAKLKPDLIVGTHAPVTKSQYETLSDLAPTLVRPKGFNDFGVPYAEQTRIIGKALGKEPAARQLVQAADASFGKARKEHPEFEGKSAVMVLPDPQSGGVWAYATEEPRGEFLNKLGFTVPERVDEAADKSFAVKLSPEQLELVGDVDLLIIVENQDPFPEYAKSKLLDDLEVSKRGNTMRVHLDDSLAVSYNTVLSIPYTVDKLAPRMAKTVAA